MTFTPGIKVILLFYFEVELCEVLVSICVTAVRTLSLWTVGEEFWRGAKLTATTPQMSSFSASKTTQVQAVQAKILQNEFKTVSLLHQTVVYFITIFSTEEHLCCFTWLAVGRLEKWSCCWLSMRHNSTGLIPKQQLKMRENSYLFFIFVWVIPSSKLGIKPTNLISCRIHSAATIDAMTLKNTSLHLRKYWHSYYIYMYIYLYTDKWLSDADVT